MAYYNLINLRKEPFSNSPDPEMFYQSDQHLSCLQKLELAIRLKRGLSVVIGDIGTGKSTICRQLLRLIDLPEDNIQAHLFLDPEFTSPLELLSTIAKSFDLDITDHRQSEWKIKDIIKNYLFEQAVENKNVPVLILDEGQKLPGFCIEILREFLNYETNKYKLLQIVIFAQKEFSQMLEEKPNFADRITTIHHLQPLSFMDTRQMIRFRIKQAQNPTDRNTPRLFTPLATFAIYLITKGYPRRIVMLCSKVIISILVKNKKYSSTLDVISCVRETSMYTRSSLIKSGLFALVAVLILSVSTITGINAYSEKTEPTQSISHSDNTTKRPISIIRPAADTPTNIDSMGIKNANSPEMAEPIFPPQSQTKTPDILGTILFDNKVTLSKMIARVYGRYTILRLNQLLKANPHISNADNVSYNTVITFPKDNNFQFTPSRNLFWVELSRTSTLAEAYAIIKDIPESNPALLIVPTIRIKSILSFVIVLEKEFLDHQSAKSTLNMLPPELQKAAIIRQA